MANVVERSGERAHTPPQYCSWSSDRLRQFQRCYRSALRGAGIGLALRGGLHSVTAATRLAKGKKPGIFRSRFWDSVRWAGALGCFGAVYVSVDEAVRTVLGCSRTAHFRSALAGAAAGPSILLTGLSRRHDEFALYFLLRGLILLIRIGNKTPASPQPSIQSQHLSHPVAPANSPRQVPPPATSVARTSWHVGPQPTGHPEHHAPQPDATTRQPRPSPLSHVHAYPAPSPSSAPNHDPGKEGPAQKSGPPAKHRTLHRLLAPTRWQHGDVLLMCAASWHIVFSYVMFPRSLPQSFIDFLDKMIGDKWLVPIVREFALRGSGYRAPDAPIKLLRGTEFEGRAGLTMCDVLHPQREHCLGCDAHVASVLPAAFWRSLGVYAPVYAASMVAVQRGALFKRPVDLLGRTAAGAARSALFLTLYIALAHRGTCFVNTLGARKGLSVWLVAAMAWLPGLAIIVEKKSRRMELAVFCTCRAILTLAKQALQRKTVPRWLVGARTDVLMFSAACACLMHCYSGGYGEHRDIFRSKYLNVLDFVFGSRGMHAGLIAHADSNRSLLLKATAATRARMRSLSAPNLTRII